MNTDSGDEFYESYERLRDLLARESHGPDRFAEASEKLPGASGSDKLSSELVISENGFRTFEGDLEVVGDLVLEDGAILFVPGNLTVAGALVCRGYYTLVLVGGKMEVEAVWSSGEIAALGGIEAQRVFWTYRNDYSAYAPTLRTPLYIAEDRVDSIDEIEVEERIQGQIAEIADDLSYEFGTGIWADREEFELHPLKVADLIRIP